MVKRKDGLYQEVLIINGSRKYFYGKTKQIVLQKIQEFKEVKEHGEKFGKIAEEWWNVHEPTLAYNSQKNYMPALKRAIEAFGDAPIKSIEPAMIAREISAFSHGRADKTVRTQLMIYNLIFRYAVEKGYVLYNPARDLSIPRNLKKNKRTSPSPEDIRRVKESTELPFGMFAYWAMYTGLRRGELLALEWNDVDLKSRTISVNKSLYYEGNKPVVKRPKTQTSVGEVPIMDVLMKKIPQGKKKALFFPMKTASISPRQNSKCSGEDIAGKQGFLHRLTNSATLMLLCCSREVFPRKTLKLFSDTLSSPLQWIYIQTCAKQSSRKFMKRSTRLI